MSMGVFGPFVAPGDTVRCPHCNKEQKVKDLLKKSPGSNTPPYYVCACNPEEVIVADPGDGRIQIFQELAHCLVSAKPSI